MTSGPAGRIHRPLTRADLDWLCAEPQALVYLTVDWSGPERLSRTVFAQTIDRLTASCPDEGRISFWVVHEKCEGFEEWAMTLAIGGNISGWGTVIWLRNGEVVWSAVNAAATGVEKLIAVTVAHFGC
jgi:hypothetical protein